MLKILFFARLRDELGTANTEVTIDNSINVVELKEQLIAQNPHWQKALTSEYILCAVNQQIVDNQHTINKGDEVAFFPPVTGG